MTTIATHFFRFRDDQGGTVAMMFGLMVFVFLAAAGMALDTSRINRFNMQGGTALDAAALAAARELTENNASDAELINLANSYFEANLRAQNQRDGQFGDLRVTIDREKGAVDLSVDGTLPTAIGRVFGVNGYHGTLSTRSIYVARDIELGMTLDVSGSMGGSRIQSLKEAASDLAEIILDSSRGPTKNRIGIAPYATSVNAGAFAQAATNNAWPWSNTCVTERTGSNRFTDAPPSETAFKKRTSSCPNAEILPMSSDLSVVTSKIDGLSANGMTAGHLGIAWAWYMVSPQWASFWPEPSAPLPHDPMKILKSVIIMTDGEFNTQYESSNGSSKSQGLALCDNMRAQGILVFTVGLNAPSSSLDLLRRCASANRYYHNTQNGEELRAAFNDIARELTALRLTH